MQVVFRLMGWGIFLVLTGCNLEPGTPVAEPVDFDKNAYAKQIRWERDSLAKLKRNPEQQIKQKPDSSRILTRNLPPIKITTDTIPVKIRYGKAKIDTVKTKGQRMVFVFDSDTANKLSLKISTADTLSNLQISRIRDSQNNSVGPFGRETEYPIQEKGLHQVMVSENPNEPWQGAFTFEVKLGW